ncbi:MAG: transglycosylase domain-containing protein [bacterium]|nr:transglycosylase domain-containing protein [bacterium]
MNLNLKKRKLATIILALIILGFITGFYQQGQLVNLYNLQASPAINDRNGEMIALEPNSKGYFNRPLENVPGKIAALLVKKEDRFFYYHFGINPLSIIQSASGYFGIGKRKASSTISQQLVKVLLGNELKRDLGNKIKETFYTLSLEVFHAKKEILKMYANSIYFGNLAQGILEASRFYFGVDPEMLTDAQIFQLLATISSPTENNPAGKKNQELTLAVSERMGFPAQESDITKVSEVLGNIKKHDRVGDSYFELKPFLAKGIDSCRVSLDQNLNSKIRETVRRNLGNLADKEVKNAAVVVIGLPENEILALIGSPDAGSLDSGYQINMLFEPRPIGSTIKPFIYLKAFEKGLRPYSLVEDREYKYITALGFPLYPKNFDYRYRGQVNLHYALSNSLNVPAVKVLEYVGLNDFYYFLENDLGIKPLQPWENYQLGIALGSLDLSLFDLARYFTIFPQQGILKDLSILKCQNVGGRTSHKTIGDPVSVILQPVVKPGYIQLVNKILSDRKTSIDQFGMKSELNLFQENYALKTGTSRDFKDSWVVGYTPDFLVGVWVGNADASPTKGVSGQQGAGLIFSEVMELLLNSSYNKKTAFEFDLVKEFRNDGDFNYGLEGDDYQKALNLLTEKDESLILLPHDNDSFLLELNTRIILRASQEVDWFANNQFLGCGKTWIFSPQAFGNGGDRVSSVYQIKAVSESGLTQELTIFVESN